MHSKIFAALLFILLPSIVAAQSNKIRFQHYANEEGLSDNAVQALHQDRQGYMWIGTQGTLYKFDGQNFIGYKPEAGDSSAISSGFIYTIEEDAHGNLWIGTRGGGVSKYDPLEDRFVQYTYDASSDNTLSNDYVRAILPDDTGKIWIGANNGVLHELNPETGEFKLYFPQAAPDNADKDRTIFDIKKSLHNPNILWLGRSDGLFQFNTLTKKFDDFTYLLNKPSDSATITVYRILEDKEGTLWVGTSEAGLQAISSSQAPYDYLRKKGISPDTAYASLLNSSVFSLTADEKGQLWIGTLGDGLIKFNPSTGELNSYNNIESNEESLSDNTITDVILDRNNLLWVGTFVGLNTYNPLSEQILYYGLKEEGKDGLSDSEVLAVIESEDGTVWLGTKEGGLNKFERSENRFYHFFNTENHELKRINVIHDDAQGRLWLGGESNFIYAFNKITESYERYKLHNSSNYTSIQDIYEAPSQPGVLWIATSHSGFFRYDIASGAIKPFSYEMSNVEAHKESLSNNYVTKLLEDSKGIFWVATRGGGINVFDPVRSSFKRFIYDSEVVTTPGSNDILTIFEDKTGNVWFGAPGGGLSRYDRESGDFTRFTVGRGDVIGILEGQGGELWLSTTNGILKFDPESGESIRLGLTEGLQGLLFRDKAHFKGQNGTLYFGGVNGLNIIQLNDLTIQSAPPDVILTKLLVNDNAYEIPGNEIDLEYDENYLVFEFAVLDYASPSENRYQYILEGQDNKWVESGMTSIARYPNLEPGTYRFGIKGANHLGVWSLNEDPVLVVNIKPPYWETLWFRLLVISVILALIYGAYKYRLYKQIEIQKTRIRGMKEMEDLRMRIAGQLHDHVSANLSTIGLKAESMSGGIGLDEKEKTRLHEITRLARDSANSIRETSWVVNTGFDRLDKLVSAMEDIGYDMVGEIVDFSFFKDSDIDDIPITMDFRQNVYYFYREALHNIIKHAKAEHVNVKVACNEGEFEMTIQDDGQGFDMETVRKSNGILLYHKRALDIHGSVRIDSTKGKGTSIQLEAPLKTLA